MHFPLFLCFSKRWSRAGNPRPKSLSIFLRGFLLACITADCKCLATMKQIAQNHNVIGLSIINLCRSLVLALEFFRTFSSEQKLVYYLMKLGLATTFDINASSVLGNNAYPLHLSWGDFARCCSVDLCHYTKKSEGHPGINKWLNHLY